MLDMSLTQIDPAVLAELPDSVRKEVLRSLAAPSGPQRPGNPRPPPVLPMQQSVPDKLVSSAVPDSQRLHVADSEALNLQQPARGPTLTECGGGDAAQWLVLHELFPADLLSELQHLPASEGWTLIQRWIEQTLFTPYFDGKRNCIPCTAGGRAPLDSAEMCVRPEQGAAIEQLLVTWTRGFIAADLEGVQGVMRGLRRFGREISQLARACAAAEVAVQDSIVERYGGRVRLM